MDRKIEDSYLIYHLGRIVREEVKDVFVGYRSEWPNLEPYHGYIFRATSLDGARPYEVAADVVLASNIKYSELLN